MGWISIPNVAVKPEFGKVLRIEQKDSNLEVVYDPFQCTSLVPIAEGSEEVKLCPEMFTNLKAWQDHAPEKHDQIQPGDRAIVSVMVEATVGMLLMKMLLVLKDKAPTNLMAGIRKPNDGHNADEVWRQVWNALERDATVIRLKETHHKWIGGLLDRMIPITKEQRDLGLEQPNVGMFLYDLDEEAVRTAFMLPPRKHDDEADGEDPEAVVEKGPALALVGANGAHEAEG